MPLSYNQYNGDGSTRAFNLDFDYIAKDHVEVRVDGFTVPYTWLDTYRVQTATAPANGAIVDVRRVTPRDGILVEFMDGSVLVETDLNLATIQSFFLAQESFDQGEASMGVTPEGHYSAGLRRISLVLDPVDPRDVVTKQWAEDTTNTNVAQGIAARDAAIAAKNAAETARNDAQTARAGAETARATAEGYLNSAIAARDAAQGYRDTANTHRVDAQAAKVAAEAARAGAEAARDTATTKASAAASSATAAAQSAVEAAKFDPANFYTKGQTYNRGEVDGGLSAAVATLTAEIEKRGVPVGHLSSYPINKVPAGYLVCDGSTYNTDMYPDLYEYLGTNVLPNYIDRVLRMAGPLAGAAGTTQEDALKAHTHPFDEAPSGGWSGTYPGKPPQTSSANASTTYQTGPQDGGEVETRVKAGIVVTCIKAFGAVNVEGMAELSALLTAIADKPTAEAGADNTKLITPLRAKQLLSAQLSEQIAAIPYGAIGSYVFAMTATSTPSGATLSGSALYPAFEWTTAAPSSGGTNGSYHSSGTNSASGRNTTAALSGTWRCMGTAQTPTAGGLQSTLWMRIA